MRLEIILLVVGAVLSIGSAAPTSWTSTGQRMPLWRVDTRSTTRAQRSHPQVSIVASVAYVAALAVLFAASVSLTTDNTAGAFITGAGVLASLLWAPQVLTALVHDWRPPGSPASPSDPAGPGPRRWRAMFGMLSVLAELQRELIAANTRDGLTAARARGRVGGRPPRLSPAQAALAQQLHHARTHAVQAHADPFSVPLHHHLRAPQDRRRPAGSQGGRRRW